MLHGNKHIALVPPFPGPRYEAPPSLTSQLDGAGSNESAEHHDLSRLQVLKPDGTFIPVPEGIIPVFSRETTKGKAKASASATRPESELFTWRPLGMPVEESQGQERPSSPKDKGKGKAKAEPEAMAMDVDIHANAHANVQLEAPDSVTPVKRKRGRPRADAQPTVPITDILG